MPDSNAAFGRHAGIDYPVGIGTPVYACISGNVSIVENDVYHGNVVDIYNGGRWYRVMHLSQIVKRSGTVQEGELIGYSGNTGLSTGPHVHWDIRTQYVPGSFAAFIDPLKALEEVQVENFKDTNDVRVNGFGLFGIELAGDNPALPIWVGKSKLEFYKGLGPQVVNNQNALKKRIAELEAAGGGDYVPAGQLYIKK